MNILLVHRCWCRFIIFGVAAVLGGVLLLVPTVEATVPYAAHGPFVDPFANDSGLPPLPWQVPGKEYSHDPDESTVGAGGVPDNKQVIAWDGIGGTADGLDYSIPFPVWDTADQLQADAIAHTKDVLFSAVQDESSHLVFSVDDAAHSTAAFGLTPVVIPSAGPIATAANILGGAGELSYELGTFGAVHPVNTQNLWATQLDINKSPLPRDVDGVEIWGPEPGSAPEDGSGVANFGDAVKYSIDTDILTLTGSPTAFCVISYPSQVGYVPHQQVVDFVTGLLIADGGQVDPDQINLDALMVFDKTRDDERFDPGDKILFSIRQVIAPAGTPDGSGFFATGSEIFWLDGASTAVAPVGGFLSHGGHIWDKKYALTDMVATLSVAGSQTIDVQLDINALEAVIVPEPELVGLMLSALALLAGSGMRFGQPRLKQTH